MALASQTRLEEQTLLGRCGRIIPEQGQLQAESLERLSVHHFILDVGGEDRPASGVQAQHFQRLREWIEHPGMRHTVAGVNA